jgi:hypothetical protein
MRLLKSLGLVMLLAVGLVSAGVQAAEETFSGTVMCAKCTLKKADATACQDVLIVKSASGPATELYIVKNDVATKFGHVCSGETPAMVVGAVAEKDGKKWITASKMEKKS